MIDRKIMRISASAILAVLLIVFILPIGESGRIATAIFLIPASVVIPILIKKRSILSINRHQVLLILTATALVLVMFYFLSGIWFGFYRNPYSPSIDNLLMYALPITAIIICTEIIRAVLMSQGDKLTAVFCYVFTVIADMLMVYNIPEIDSFNRFMDLVAGALFPALLSNLLYNYLAKRYGMYPNLSFRLITTLYAYLFPLASGIEESIISFCKLVIPVLIFVFIDALYEKRRKYALGNKSRALRAVSGVLTVLAACIMAATVMLVSNQFKYGSLVIATESMTGEINKGDVVIFESYDNQTVEEGQVIVFKSRNSMIVHRVVDIEIINGNTRYYTKGDANEDKDVGFITDADIVGFANFKVPLIGYPTLWVRSLFER